MNRLLPALILVAACGKTERPNKLMETGWFNHTGAWGAGECKSRLGGIEPANGATDWYHRDAPSLWVENADPEAYTVSLVDSTGVPAQVNPVWDETGLNLTFEIVQPLRPNTDYTITVTDCAAIHRSGFRTSNLGLPLDIQPSDLVGRTWHLDMLGANWVEPGGATALIQLYFSAPALLGVRFADATHIDLLGAQGEVDPFGQMYQGLGSTWDFPTGDLTGPFFEANANLVVFQFDGVEIPIHTARLAGTLSPDGMRIGGGELSGLGDTRDLGAFLPGGGNDENAICDLAESLGIQCQACPDGEQLCMFLDARQIDGTLIDGLSLIPRN